MILGWAFSQCTSVNNEKQKAVDARINCFCVTAKLSADHALLKDPEQPVEVHPHTAANPCPGYNARGGEVITESTEGDANFRLRQAFNELHTSAPHNMDSEG